MPGDVLMATGLRRIRERLTETGRASHTTPKFQDDLLDLLEKSSQNGVKLIEVGCYMGGLTAQLAFCARELGLHLDVIDIDSHYINEANKSLDICELTGVVAFHASTLSEFVRNSPRYGRPALVFIDGDHRYSGVRADIEAIRSFEETPYACVFHDFSLRYADGSLTDVRVDRAIYDGFGADVSLIPIGEVAGEGRLRVEPGDDRHFHERGQPEGVAILL